MYHNVNELSARSSDLCATRKMSKAKETWEVNAEIIKRQEVMMAYRCAERRRAFARDEARFLDPHDSFGVRSTSLVPRQLDFRCLQAMTVCKSSYLCEEELRKHNTIFEALDGKHGQQRHWFVWRDVMARHPVAVGPVIESQMPRSS